MKKLDKYMIRETTDLENDVEALEYLITAARMIQSRIEESPYRIDIGSDTFKSVDLLLKVSHEIEEICQKALIALTKEGGDSTES